MQSLRRKSLWVALSASWLLFVLLGVFPLLRPAVPPRPQPGASPGWPRWLDAELLQSFSQPEEPTEDAPGCPRSPQGGRCTWGTCFDTSRCRDGLKVFVYPVAGPTSEMHHRVTASLEGSLYGTSSPAEACLLLFLSSDTPAGGCSPEPPHWNSGSNHLVLSLHSAPCPWASQLGRAMVAEASPKVDTFRPGFDVALPLLPEAHPLRGGAPGQLWQHSPQPGLALLAVAEKMGRWRPADVHSPPVGWDGHCEQDSGAEPTHPGERPPNATFCLIPGHRTEAWRFLQALQAGCIPVLLSPCWELPFSEVIDWTKAAIIVDDRLPLQVLAALQEMSPARVLALRQQTQFLWDAYFSSVEKVIWTTLEIIQDRFFGAPTHPSLLWNSPPGALLARPTFSLSPQEFPFYHLQLGSRPEGRFSTLIWVGPPGQTPLKLIQAVAASQHCAQVRPLHQLEAWYYHTLFTHSLPKALRTLADEAPTCVDVLMNFLVAAVTKLPPIKVPYGKQPLGAAALAPGGPGPEPQPSAPDCINQMAAEFGHMPLVSSRVRLDPVLFKDPVSVQRKKYRSLEKP
uniref:exostosin-like 1 n=1 Tax=Callospermophilus lateralis TaxID=76772 RepID=UPI004038B3D9